MCEDVMFYVYGTYFAVSFCFCIVATLKKYSVDPIQKLSFKNNLTQSTGNTVNGDVQDSLVEIRVLKINYCLFLFLAFSDKYYTLAFYCVL